MPASFDEDLIERYVRRSGRLSGREREQAEQLLKTNPAAREIAELLVLFYDDLEAPGAERAPQVEAFLNELFPPAPIIPLRPLRPGSHSARRRTVLAAMTPRATRRFEPVATLASEEENVLVRLLCDRTSHQCRLYAIAGAPEERRARALISFPELDLRFVTDERGRVDFTLTGAQLDADWASARATLAVPLGACMLDVEKLEEGACALPLDSGHTLRYTREGATLSLTVEAGGDQALPSSALVEAGEERLLLTLREGTGTVRLDEWPGDVDVWLYP